MRNLKDRVFGKLTVIERAESDKNKRLRWKCLCECGNQTTVNSGNLVQGITKSCGCNKNIPRRRINLIGECFGRLTVISFDRSENGKAYWKCECVCGGTKIVPTVYLQTKRVRSCGCAKFSQIPEYPRQESWSMKIRRFQGNICLKCDSSEALHSHHIIAKCRNRKYRYSLSNGISLCSACHRRLHSLFGHKTDISHLVLFFGLSDLEEKIIEILIKEENGREDLEKAKHYIDLLIAAKYENQTQPQKTH